MSTSGESSSPTLGRLRQQIKVSANASPALTDTSLGSPLLEHITRERLNVDNQSHTPSNRSNTNTPKHADETVSSPLFPPLPSHYSFLTIIIYRVLSMFLSIGFLIVVVVCAMATTVPSLAWVLWSWFCFKDPNRKRPFYLQEKRRTHIDPGKLKCDIGYYAQRVGLDCEEFKIETEDGYILAIQHIVDRNPGSVDPKSTNFYGMADE